MRGQECVVISNLSTPTSATFQLRGGMYAASFSGAGGAAIITELQSNGDQVLALGIGAPGAYQTGALPPGNYFITNNTGGTITLSVARIPGE